MTQSLQSSSNDRLTFVDWSVVLFYGVSVPIYLLRVVSRGEDSAVTWLLLRLPEPMVMVAALCGLLMTRRRLDFYAIISIALLLYGLIVALLQKNLLSDIVAGCIHFATGLCLYLYYYNTALCWSRVRKILKTIAFVALIAFLPTVLLIEIIAKVIGVDIYLGLASQSVLATFVYGLASSSALLSGLSVVTIFLSGKRGVLVALALSLIVYAGLAILRWRPTLVLKFLVLGGIGIFALLVAEPDAFVAALEKFVPDDDISVNQYSSGRLVEAQSAIAYFLEQKDRIIFGAGFGFKYIFFGDDVYGRQEDYKNVHLSIINPIIIFGLPAFIVYFLNLYVLVILAVSMPRRDIRTALQVLVVTLLIYSCFVFNLFNEPLLWLSLGLLRNPFLNLMLPNATPHILSPNAITDRGTKGVLI